MTMTIEDYSDSVHGDSENGLRSRSRQNPIRTPPPVRGGVVWSCGKEFGMGWVGLGLRLAYYTTHP